MFGHNKSGGLFSKGAGGMPAGPRQLTMVPAGGLSGNGMATIGLDNTFSMIAHLPPIHTLSPYSPAVYAAYLVDSKGKNGFYAGTLKSAGNGMYQASFRSPIPLVHYNKVVVSLESPQRIGQAPQGPIVMKVKEGLLDGLGPVKKIGGDMWGKVKGFVGNRFGGKTEEEPQVPQQQVPQQQIPQQQIPGGAQGYQQYPQSQHYHSEQGGYYQQGRYPQPGSYNPHTQPQIPYGMQPQVQYQVSQPQQNMQPQPYNTPISPGISANAGSSAGQSTAYNEIAAENLPQQQPSAGVDTENQSE